MLANNTDQSSSPTVQINSMLSKNLSPNSMHHESTTPLSSLKSWSRKSFGSLNDIIRTSIRTIQTNLIVRWWLNQNLKKSSNLLRSQHLKETLQNLTTYSKIIVI